MSSERIYLHKRSDSGIYCLLIVSIIDGKRSVKKISCGTKYKNEALTFLKNYEKNKDSEIINPHLKLSDIRDPVLDYVNSNLSKASLHKYELTIRTIVSILGDAEINSIQLKDIERLKSSLSRRMRKESVNIYVRYIKAIWNLLVKLGYIKHNTLTCIKQFKTHEKEILSFTDEELELIIAAIPDDRIKRIVRMASETGLRISELLNLRVKNIDIKNELIHLNNNSEFQTKSGKNRIIPFNYTIKNIISECINNTNSGNDLFLFRQRFNFPFKRSYITRYFRGILDELNFDKKYHFHCLRATFIMRLVRKGVNPIFIQRLAGHSTLAVTQKYCFVQVSDLRKAINTD